LDTEGCIEKVGIIATWMLYDVRDDPEFGEHTQTGEEYSYQADDSK
jgi:hypothetical protein